MQADTCREGRWKWEHHGEERAYTYSVWSTMVFELPQTIQNMMGTIVITGN